MKDTAINGRTQPIILSAKQNVQTGVQMLSSKPVPVQPLISDNKIQAVDESATVQTPEQQQVSWLKEIVTHLPESVKVTDVSAPSC